MPGKPPGGHFNLPVHTLLKIRPRLKCSAEVFVGKADGPEEADGAAAQTPTDTFY